MANKIIKLPIWDIQIELVPMPGGKELEARIQANTPRQVGNLNLDIGTNSCLVFIGACAAAGVDVEDKKFEKAMRQALTHIVRQLGDPRFPTN